MKKIKTKILIILMSTILLVGAIVGVSSVVIISQSNESTLITTITEMVDVVAFGANKSLGTYTAAVGEVASNSVLLQGDQSAKKEFLDEKLVQYYMRSYGLADMNGDDAFSGENVANEDFFKSAAEGRSYVSTPYITETNGERDMYMVVASPVYEDGEVVGVLYFKCDTYLFEEIIANVSVGETGLSYMLDKNGVTIAYNDIEVVYAQENLIQDAQLYPDDEEIQQLAVLEQKMVNGESGWGFYDSDGVKNLQVYTTIPGTDNWSIAISVEVDEYMSQANRGISIMFLVIAVIAVLGLFLSILLGNSFSKPIELCKERVVMLTQGDITSPMPEIKSKDEIAVLAQAIGELLHGFNFMIGDLKERLSKLAQGDLTDNHDRVEFKGDFVELQNAVDMIFDSLNNTMSGIVGVSDEVLRGSEQVASGAVELSQSAAVQVDTIEFITSSIGDIKDQMQVITDNSRSASKLSSSTGKGLTEANEDMQKLLSAMSHMQDQVTGISKIIKTINDIAFQTNILALNASVEAARAGSAGKGFAVVAEEVRNLANKSAQAARDTESLIDGTISSALNGAELAKITAQSLTNLVEFSDDAAKNSHSISNSILEQNDKIAEINNSLNQMTNTAQVTSGTGKESARLSAELMDLSSNLQGLIQRFELKDNGEN